MKLITTPDTSARRIAAVGMYDGVHLGHRFLLEYMGVEARHRGLQPTAVTFSRHPLALIRPLEAPALLSTLEDRVRALGQAGAEAVVVLSFNESLRHLTAREFMNLLHRKFAIDVLLLGFNNRFGHDGLKSLDEYRRIGAEVGIEVIEAPEYRARETPVSSSAIRRLLMDGKPEKAADLMGRPFAIRGRVVDGNHLGRQLGFATANIVPSDPSIIIPRSGAYAVRVITPDGEHRKGMLNIGFRPTVSGDAQSEKLSIEAHIFDYQGYIYDEEIEVEFIRYLRPEKRFSDTDRLVRQLESDAKTARKILAE